MFSSQKLRGYQSRYASKTVATLKSTASAWSRASNVAWVFLRNLGASILLMFVDRTELPKTIVRRSLLISFLRCFVHMFPMAITGFVAWLNLAGYFIGDQMAGGAENRDRDFLLLQIAAKVTVRSHFHEDFCEDICSINPSCRSCVWSHP